MIESTLSGEGHLWRLIRSWWWALALGAALAGIAGYAIATKLPKTYSSTVTLLVGPINTDASLDASGALTATYEDLATSRPVLTAAIRAAHAPLSADRLQAAVSTTSNSVSRLVTISVTNRNRRLASNLANALGRRVATLANTTPQPTNAAISAFEQDAAVQALSDPQRIGVENALRRVFGVAPAGVVTVLDPAVPASAAASPKKSLIAVLAALAGLAVSACALLFRMSGRRSAADSLPELGPGYLGLVDISPSRRPEDAVSVEARPGSGQAAEFRMLAVRLGLDQSTTRSLLVVDSTDGSAAAVVAANIAAATARTTNRSVVLADVGAERGAVTKLLGLEGHEGFAELLAAPDLSALNGRLDELIFDRGEGVGVLPRGAGDSDGSVSVERARSVLRRLRSKTDLVVLSGPPVARSPSGLTWARAADGVLFVVDGNKISHDGAMQAIKDLRLANQNFLGTVAGRRRPVLPVLRRATAIRA